MLAALCTVLAGCGNDAADEPSGSGGTGGGGGAAGTGGASGAGFQWPTTGWAVDSPESQGMDPAVFEAAHEYAFADAKNTQGVVVIRHGVIVAEWYADGHDEDSWATSWSMGKSFGSTLIGIAIDEGLIENADVPMSDYYPEWKDDDRSKITLRHVLSMTSGRKWTETYDLSNPDSDMVTMGLKVDELTYARSNGAEVPPGTRWQYASGDSMLMSGVIEAVTGKTALDYAQKRLFDPIGMDKAQWWVDGKNHALTFCCVDTTSREFAKLGFLFLHGGEWDGQQIVSKAWVDEATRPSQKLFDGYGLQWWVNNDATLPDDMFYADGLDGQFIYVMPSQDLVVVRNGSYEKAAGDAVAPLGILLKIVPRAVLDGTGTLPPDSWDHATFLQPFIESITD